MLRMFTVFNLCPKIPSQEFSQVHRFTDAKGVLLMIHKLGFLNFIRNRTLNLERRTER